MGEILAVAILLILLFAGAVAFTAMTQNQQKERKDVTDTPDYRNHLAMARWIEHVLDDDMERVVIPEQRQTAARKLLAAFYREDSK